MSKSEKKWLWIGGVAATVAIVALVVRKTISGIIVLTPRITNLKINWATATFTGTLEIPINNKNNISFPPASFAGGIYYQGLYKLVDVFVTDPFKLAGDQVSVLRANFVVNFADLSTELSRIIQSRAFLPSLYLKGVLSAGSFNVRLNQNIQVI